MNVFKSQAERRVEAFTWGALLVWVGASLIVDLHRGVPSLVAGLILLTSAIIQRVMGWEAGIILWAGGLALSISGHHHLSALAIILILIGGSILLRAISGPGPRARRRKRILEAVQQQPDASDRGPYRDI